MTEPEAPSHEFFDEEIREARERLRISLYKGAEPRVGDRTSRLWLWMWLPLMVCYSSLGTLMLLSSEPPPPKVAGLAMFVSAGAMFAAWERGRAAIRARRHVRRAIDEHLRHIDRLVQKSIEVSRKARTAADVRHESNRKRQRSAKEFYQSRPWATQADAARAIADSFNVTEKVAARWVAEWRKEGNSASQGETPYGEE